MWLRYKGAKTAGKENLKFTVKFSSNYLQVMLLVVKSFSFSRDLKNAYIFKMGVNQNRRRGIRYGKYM